MVRLDCAFNNAGTFKGGPVHEMSEEDWDEVDGARIMGLSPMKRVGQPAEIAAAVVWMCSDAASFVTGQTLSVDGGVIAGLTPNH